MYSRKGGLNTRCRITRDNPHVRLLRRIVVHGGSRDKRVDGIEQRNWEDGSGIAGIEEGLSLAVGYVGNIRLQRNGHPIDKDAFEECGPPISSFWELRKFGFIGDTGEAIIILSNGERAASRVLQIAGACEVETDEVGLRWVLSEDVAQNRAAPSGIRSVDAFDFLVDWRRAGEVKAETHETVDPIFLKSSDCCRGGAHECLSFDVVWAECKRRYTNGPFSSIGTISI
jgi:hypothetical protein